MSFFKGERFYGLKSFVFYLQAQPLSLEELLAKKKAEEEAEAKVRTGEFVLVG